MSNKKLIIVYQTDDNQVELELAENPPYLSDKDQYTTYALGILYGNKIPFKKIVELCLHDIIFSETEDSLRALKKLYGKLYEDQ